MFAVNIKGDSHSLGHGGGGGGGQCGCQYFHAGLTTRNKMRGDTEAYEVPLVHMPLVCLHNALIDVTVCGPAILALVSDVLCMHVCPWVGALTLVVNEVHIRHSLSVILNSAAGSDGFLRSM